MKLTKLDEVATGVRIEDLLSDLETVISALRAYIKRQKEAPPSTVLTRIWSAHDALSEVYADVEALRLKHR
jgi:hypothetical protein